MIRARPICTRETLPTVTHDHARKWSSVFAVVFHRIVSFKTFTCQTRASISLIIALKAPKVWLLFFLTFFNWDLAEQLIRNSDPHYPKSESDCNGAYGSPPEYNGSYFIYNEWGQWGISHVPLEGGVSRSIKARPDYYTPAYFSVNHCAHHSTRQMKRKDVAKRTITVDGVEFTVAMRLTVTRMQVTVTFDLVFELLNFCKRPWTFAFLP